MEKIKSTNSRPSSGNLWQVLIRQTINVGPDTPQVRLNRIYQIIPKSTRDLVDFIFPTFLTKPGRSPENFISPGFLMCVLLLCGSYSCTSTVPDIKVKLAEEIVEKEQTSRITEPSSPSREISKNRASASSERSSLYKIGVPDELHISVWQEPTLTTQTKVRPDGMIAFPLIDDIVAEGLTVNELKKGITKKLKRFIIDPLVHVRILAIKSRRVLVMGAVKNPKVLQLTHPITVLEAITEAGGIASDELTGAEVADLDNAYLTRNNRILDIDFKRLMRESDMSQNIYLERDDVIYIAHSVSPGSEVYVLGEVGRPSSIPLKKGTRVFEAIARAGGFIENDANYIKIVRGNLKEPELIHININKYYQGDMKQNIMLKHHDVVYVTAKPLTKYARFMSKVITGLNTLKALSDGINATNEAVGILKNIGQAKD